MARLLFILVVIGLLALAVVQLRAGRLHFRIADWPLGKQVEAGLAVLFAAVAALGLAAQEYGFALWLGLMAALIAAFSLLTWPKKR
ncbi:hypothetical protein AAG565_01260 [Fontimonas sp. SYSU GA230001]|uniref:hypothetical protein n=1 Tax=Fontimonas sp. SYSU GA230001 TaxID=3142450 RepID=UPI0032B45DBB